jgi:hypothetical protein
MQIDECLFVGDGEKHEVVAVIVPTGSYAWIGHAEGHSSMYCLTSLVTRREIIPHHYIQLGWAHPLGVGLDGGSDGVGALMEVHGDDHA